MEDGKAQKGLAVFLFRRYPSACRFAKPCCLC